MTPAGPARSALRPGPVRVPTVLVVENRVELRELMVQILRLRDCTVVEAGDGDAALRIAEQHTAVVDLLVTDLALPGLRGDELARRLAVRHPGLRVLYVSGYLDDAIEREASQQPGRAALPKPFTVHALLAKVDALLSG